MSSLPSSHWQSPLSTPFTVDWNRMLDCVPIASLEFEAFSERILGGLIAQSDAQIATIKRHKEDGHVRHEFVTVKVTSAGEEFWLRIERRVRNKAKLLTFEGSLSCIDSSDTVKLAKTEAELLQLSPQSQVKSTVLFAGPEKSKPNLKNLARLLAAIRKTCPTYHPLANNCFFVACMLQEVLSNEKIYKPSLEGKTSTWAAQRASTERHAIIKEYYTPSPRVV